MKKLIEFKGMKDNKIIKNFLRVFTGTGLAQIVSIIASIILARIYSPDDFGKLALMVTVVSLCSMVATFKYDAAITVAKKRKEIFKLVITSTFFVFLTFLITLVIIITFSDFFMKRLNVDLFFLLLVPLGILMVGLIQVFTSSNTRFKNYKLTSNTTVSQSFITAISQTILGLLFYLSSGLIIGQLIGQIYKVFKLIKNQSYYFSATLYKKYISLKVIINTTKEYKDYPLKLGPATILSGVSNNIIILFLGIFFSSNIVGFYAMGQKLIRIPSAVLGTALRQIYFQEGAAIYRKNPIKLLGFTRKIFVILSIAAIVPSLILFFLSEQIFYLLFGEEWILSGTISSILSVYLYFQFVSSPLISTFTILQKQKLHFYWELFRLALLLGGVVIGGLNGNIVYFSWIITFTLSFSYLLLIAMVFWVLRSNDN
ncbi:lipopolysaccharide biosynthesis protein [Planococcus ruber]|uniref:lipopolysaccharide biosynthesis protein n=1 Tax=Planococcus ruber TaxID=2027871 RepID=UPI001FED70A4|nr:oligosaccharide flippase family protein [Planococcus ruber]MCJ1908282.1 oligosaccharide flippase family protein [Planococcus ruber]